MVPPLSYVDAAVDSCMKATGGYNGRLLVNNWDRAAMLPQNRDVIESA
jgi:hypothetical protein